MTLFEFKSSPQAFSTQVGGREPTEPLLNMTVYTATTSTVTRTELVLINLTSLVPAGFASSLRPQVPPSPRSSHRSSKQCYWSYPLQLYRLQNTTRAGHTAILPYEPSRERGEIDLSQAGATASGLT